MATDLCCGADHAPIYAAGMARFAILIDDGQSISSSAETEYPNLLCAMADTLRTAAIIAAERAPAVGLEQCLTCEVQDLRSRERRAMIVRFDNCT